MKRRSLILAILAIGCLVATATLTPGLSTAQTDNVKAAMADLKAKTEKLGVPKVEGKDLYFGTTKVDNSVVDAVAKEHGGVATLFVKSGDRVRACGHDGPEGGRYKRGRNRPGPKERRYCKTQQWRSVLWRRDRFRQDLRRWI